MLLWALRLKALEKPGVESMTHRFDESWIKTRARGARFPYTFIKMFMLKYVTSCGLTDLNAAAETDRKNHFNK